MLGQDAICLFDFFESLFGQLFKLFSEMMNLVRMVFIGELPIGTLDLVVCGISFDTEYPERIIGGGIGTKRLLVAGPGTLGSVVPLVEILVISVVKTTVLKRRFFNGIEKPPQEEKDNQIVQPAPAQGKIRHNIVWGQGVEYRQYGKQNLHFSIIN